MKRLLITIVSVITAVVVILLIFLAYGSLNNRFYRVITVEGNSMSPTLWFGDLIRGHPTCRNPAGEHDCADDGKWKICHSPRRRVRPGWRHNHQRGCERGGRPFFARNGQNCRCVPFSPAGLRLSAALSFQSPGAFMGLNLPKSSESSIKNLKTITGVHP